MAVENKILMTQLQYWTVIIKLVEKCLYLDFTFAQINNLIIIIIT